MLNKFLLLSYVGITSKLNNYCFKQQVVEDGYEFFAKRQLVTLFSAPNYCGEFDNAGAMMSVDETLMCSFQVNIFCCLALESCIMVKTNVLWMITVGYVYKRIKNCQTRKWLYFVHYEFCWTRNLLYYYFPLFPFSSLPQGSKKVLSSSLGQFDFHT